MDKGKPDTFYDKNETDKKLILISFYFVENSKYVNILYWLV